MTCEVVQAERIAERYAQGGLTAEERTAFEAHYATCTLCFEELRALEARLGLSPHRAPRKKKRRKKHRARKYGWVAILAGVLAGAAVLAVVLEQYRPPSSEPPPTPAEASPPSPAAPEPKPVPDPAVIAALAKMEPPVYIESKRHGPDNAAYKAFQKAMEPYQFNDYAKAAPALRAAAQLDYKSPAPRFYLAICELAQQQTDDAIGDLHAVIELGDTPYLEDAHFFLAKALLATHDLREAREELFRTIRIAGDRLSDARHVLDQLEAQMSRK
jgi:tetratricopeptide (TPR) repeat protein